MLRVFFCVCSSLFVLGLFFIAGLDRDDEVAFRESQGLLDGFRQAGADFRVHLQAIDHDGNVVFDPPVQFEIVGEPDDLAIDAGPQVAAFEHVLKEVLVFSLLPAHHGRQDQETRAGGQRENAIEDLFARLRGDGPIAIRAMSLTDARVENAKVIVNLGDGANRGARIFTGGFLLNADRGRQPAEVIDVGFLELAKKLTRVR